MYKGVNIDITNNPPNPGDLFKWGCDAVRFPARPGINWYVAQLNQYGIRSISVVDKQAGGLIIPEASAHQIHNEPDISGQASGTMPSSQLIDELRIYRETYPELVLIGPGLAAGDFNATYLRQIVGALRKYSYSGWAIHPYAKTPVSARDLFNAHQAAAPDLPGLYSECHPDHNQIRQFYKYARDAGCMGVFYHCWTDAMTLDSEGLRLGLVDEHGNHKQPFDIWALS